MSAQPSQVRNIKEVANPLAEYQAMVGILHAKIDNDLLNRLHAVMNFGSLRNSLSTIIEVGEELDCIKKFVFYGKTKFDRDTIGGIDGANSVNFITSEELEKSTVSAEDLSDTDLKNIRIFHGLIGLLTEMPEIIRALFNVVKTDRGYEEEGEEGVKFEEVETESTDDNPFGMRHDIDYVNMIEELGDCFWYLTEAAYFGTGCGIIDVIATNDAKLVTRYQKKGSSGNTFSFSQEAANQRNLDSERLAMESSIK